MPSEEHGPGVPRYRRDSGEQHQDTRESKLVNIKTLKRNRDPLYWIYKSGKGFG